MGIVNHPDIKDLLGSRIKKLQQLQELIADPEISDEVHRLFGGKISVEVAPVKQKMATTAKKQTGGRTIAPKKMKMIRTAEEIVNKSVGPVSARQVSEQMASEGFKFGAKNQNVAISKCLRWLHKKGKLNAAQGATPKSPIMYSRI